MSKNIFFESKGPFKLNILFPSHSTSNVKVNDIKTLDKAGKLEKSETKNKIIFIFECIYTIFLNYQYFKQLNLALF